MAQDWTRIEGMIIGHDLDPSVVAGELKDRSILAQLEWFPSSPQMLGLNVAVDEERVATVPAGSTEVVPGPTPAELADELGKADSVIVTPVFAAWSETGPVSGADLAAATGAKARYLEGGWPEIAQKALEYDGAAPLLLAVIGAGDIEQIFHWLPGGENA